MVLGPSSRCRFSPALLQGSGGLHGAVRTPNPPSETPGVSVGNIRAAGGEQTPAPCSRGDPTARDVLHATQICLVQGVGIVWWLYGRADPRAPLKAPVFFFLHLAFDQRESFHEDISEQKGADGTPWMSSVLFLLLLVKVKLKVSKLCWKKGS